MLGTTAFAQRNGPSVLTPMTFIHSSEDISSKGRSVLISPALLTSTSMPPKRLMQAAAIARTSASDETSVWMP